MTESERFLATMRYQPRDRSPICDFSFWDETLPIWHEQGLPRTLESVERDLIDSVLRRHAGNKTRAARELRISRRNLIRKVQKYQLDQVQDHGHGAAAAAPDEGGF